MNINLKYRSNVDGFNVEIVVDGEVLSRLDEL